MPRIALSLALAFALVAGLTGCNPIATNVPPLTGDTAFHSPNTGSVVDVEAESLRYTLKRFAAPERYAVDLPYGTADASYAQVLGVLPAGGRRADASSEALPTYRVVQVRVRRTVAMVDIVVPESATEQLVTVTCIKQTVGLGSWYARSARVWRVPVEKALMMSTAGLVPADEPATPGSEPGSEHAPAPAPGGEPADGPASDLTPPDAPDEPDSPVEDSDASVPSE